MYRIEYSIDKRKSWENNYINKNVFDFFIMNFEDFEKLQKLYKFFPSVRDKIFVDKKHNCLVAKLRERNNKQYDILFNKKWLFDELMITDSETIKEIMQNYSELQSLYKKYIDRKELLLQKFKQRLAKWSFKNIMSDYDYEDDEDEYEEDY